MKKEYFYFTEGLFIDGAIQKETPMLGTPVPSQRTGNVIFKNVNEVNCSHHYGNGCYPFHKWEINPGQFMSSEVIPGIRVVIKKAYNWRVLTMGGRKIVEFSTKDIPTFCKFLNENRMEVSNPEELPEEFAKLLTYKLEYQLANTDLDSEALSKHIERQKNQFQKVD